MDLESAVVLSISMKLATEAASKRRMSAVTLIMGSRSGYTGMKTGESMAGAPPMALSMLQAVVMCSISSITTECSVAPAKFELFTMLKSDVR